MKWAFLAYCVIWFSSALAAIGVAYFTKSPWCVLIMILPALTEMKVRKK